MQIDLNQGQPSLPPPLPRPREGQPTLICPGGQNMPILLPDDQDRRKMPVWAEQEEGTDE